MSTGGEQGREAARPRSTNGSARAHLPARGRQMLAELLSLCDKHLEPRIQVVLDEACEQLFRLADQSHNDAEQQNHLAGMREIKRARADVSPRFVSALTARFDRLGQSSDDTPSDNDFGNLELVDPEQFEEKVVLEDVAARVTSRASLPLFELGYRVAVLMTSPFLESDTLPFGPHAIGDAFRESTAQLDLAPQQRRLLYQLFEQHMSTAMRGLYDEANELLVRQRILPNLKVAVQRRPGSAGTGAGDQAVGVESPAELEPNDLIAPADAMAAPAERPRLEALTPEADTGDAALFSVLSELLAKRRSVLGIDATTQEGGRAAAPDEVLDVLADLQHKPPPPMMVNGRPVPRDIQHLRQDMLAQLRRFGDGDQAPRLNREQNDTIDLMSMLFDHVGRDLRENGNAQSLLTRLQVPLLRVALTDHGFFSRREHPARQLLDTVTETARTWLDGDDSDPALAKQLRALTHRITHDFDGDMSVFAEARDEIETQVDKLRKRAEMAERRHVEAAQGRERLDLAREKARMLVEERIREGQPTGLLRTMLEQAWTDVLALTILRWGERSDAFRKRLRVTDQLLRFSSDRVDEDDRDELRAEVESGLGQVGIQGDEAQQIAIRVTHDGSAPPAETDVEGKTAGADVPSRTELVTRLKQHKRFGDDERRPAAESKPDSKSIPLSEAENQALEKIRQLPFGTWLEAISEDGRPMRRKLAWFSPVTGHCLLVNQRGARCAEGTLQELARSVVKGSIRLPSGKAESLIDRAWRTIVGSLKQFAGKDDEDSAEGVPA